MEVAAAQQPVAADGPLRGPPLNHQHSAVFAALWPEEIGVELTEEEMIEPEASVSALVFHHPDARYFGV